MKPINFKGATVTFGENQPEYQPLPAMVLGDNQGSVITCWELTDDEIIEVFRNRRIYLKQLTFNKPLQPILPMVGLEDGLEII